ncbi:hypothetical protein CCR75_009247 [Bremia lactucae]|uniref:Uncharacterized protein n=1 Tax=Bremia lactucae TaxID=4779 RepID=A0A976FJF3_BRELC|nr:hypothetical protein CCR75_009247 [Bremia lactucae]
MMGGIVLQTLPGFLVCTHSQITRIAMLDFLKAYLEGKVIAIASPYVRMPQHIVEKTLLLQLLECCEVQTESDVMSRDLKCLQLSYLATMERDDITAPSLPATANGSIPIALSSSYFHQWSGGKHGASYFWRPLSTWCHVPNNSSWLCTSQLRHGDLSFPDFVTFNAFPVLPAARHITRVLSVADETTGTVQVQHHREFTGYPIAPLHVSGLTF